MSQSQIKLNQNVLPCLKERPSWVKSRDSRQVFHLLPDKPRHVSSEAEPDQVGVVVDLNTDIIIDRTDESRHLKVDERY